MFVLSVIMAGTRCVPWHSWAEWEFVADAFLRRRRLPEKDDDEKDDEEKKTEKKRRALELVQMWRTRGRVPVAVDAHAQIVELQLMDEEMMKKKNNPHDDGDGEDKKKETTTSNQQSESTLRLSYAMTLTRLVNGICDQSQKGKFAVSVQTLATQLDVPRTLVDIRHDSTHNQLPSIQRLRKASEDAIEWLEVKYWERQKQKLERVVEEMRLAIRAMVECEKRQKKNKDGDADGDADDADGNKDSDSDDESMYDSEEEMHMKTEKANKMKKEKETRKKTKNSAMGRLKRLVPKSKPDQMLVRAFTRELLDAHADERNNLVATNTTTEKERGKNNNANRGAADTVIVRAFSNVIEQIDSRVVNGFSCAVLEFGTEEVLHELANDARKIINPVFEFAWKHAVRRDEAKAKFIAQWYQRRDGANTTTYVQKKFQMLMSSSLEDATDGGGGGSKNNNNKKKKKKKKKNAKKHKRQQREKEDDTNNDTAAWRKAKPGEWVPGAPIGAPSRAIFVPREVVGGNNGVDKIVLELDAFTPRKKQKMERRNASFSYRKNEFLDVDLEYNEDEKDGDDRLHSFLQDAAAAAADDDDDDDDDEMGEEENEDAAKAKITVNGARVRLNDRDVNGVKDNVACLL